jgi:hypothetical protein
MDLRRVSRGFTAQTAPSAAAARGPAAKVQRKPARAASGRAQLIQREIAKPGEPENGKGPGKPPAPQPEEGETPAVSKAPDLDELARKIYPILRRMLSYDRERY